MATISSTTVYQATTLATVASPATLAVSALIATTIGIKQPMALITPGMPARIALRVVVTLIHLAAAETKATDPLVSMATATKLLTTPSAIVVLASLVALAEAQATTQAVLITTTAQPITMPTTAADSALLLTHPAAAEIKAMVLLA